MDTDLDRGTGHSVYQLQLIFYSAEKNKVEVRKTRPRQGFHLHFWVQEPLRS